MPSQVVQLPASTLAAILDHCTRVRSLILATRDLQAFEALTADGSRALRIHLQPLVYCPDQRDHFVDDVYALLLVSGPSAVAPPRSLSNGLALHILNEAEVALQELTDLTGHERLAISNSFEQAKMASPVARLPRHRRPASGYELGLLAEGYRVQSIIAPAIARLDRKLESYKASLQASGLRAAVLRLGLQSELGLRLRLNPAGGRMHMPRLFGATRRGGLGALLRATHNELNAFQQAAEAIHEASVADTTWLTTASLSRLHRTLLSGLPGLESAGLFRTSEMRIRSPIDGHITVLELPGSEVNEACTNFAAGFDAALWQDLHPMIRAAAAHLEFVRIHPFSDGNGRLARILTQGLLLESDIPPLPLEAILAWNRAPYLSAVSRAVQQRELLGFMQFVLKAIDQAVLVGRQMIRYLRSHCDRVRESFLAAGAGGRLALIASELAGSMVMGPDPQFARRTLHPVELSWLLNDSPQFNEVQACSLGFSLGGYDSDSAYSSPVARALTAAPLTLM